MPIYENEIGTTYGGMTNIESLTVPLPNMQSFYKPYAQVTDLGSGETKGLGSPQTEWKWNLLTRAQRDQLRQFCTGSSATVYIRTRINDNTDEYLDFRAIMIWPLEEERFARKRMDFTIVFKHMVAV